MGFAGLQRACLAGFANETAVCSCPGKAMDQPWAGRAGQKMRLNTGAIFAFRSAITYPLLLWNYETIRK
jgi:hypothetical protein